MTIFLVLAGLVAVWQLSVEYYAYKTGVPTVASFPASRQVIVEALRPYLAAKAGPSPYTIVDLGSGNGQLATAIARAFPQVKVVGIEISFLPWLLSRLRNKIVGPANLRFERLDFWTYDCGSVDAVVLFLTGSSFLARVGDKLRRELKQGALVIANDESLGIDWRPVAVMDTGKPASKVFVYQQQ